MSNFNQEEVVSVHHWTDTLFSFRTTRNPTFRFRNGQFTMIGLEVEGRPLLRAYSVVSPNYEENLEFSTILWNKGIGNALRIWDGHSHDWPYWEQMIVRYVGGHD